MKRNLLVGSSVGLGGIEAVLVDENFKIVERQARDFSGRLGKESIAARLEKTITSLSKFHLAFGVGVALPAVFSEGGKKIIDSSIEELVGANFYQLLSKKIDLPISISRRSYCNMLAEQAFGAAKGVKNAVFVEIGRDIEAAILVNGKIYRGQNNAAGQISKIIVDITREKRNEAGSFGALISGEGIEALTGKSIYQILEENPQSELVSQHILRDLKESLLTGLYNVKLLFDPEVFIICGDIIENFDLFRSSFVELEVKVVKSELGRDAALLGAAITAYNQAKKAFRFQPSAVSNDL